MTRADTALWLVALLGGCDPRPSSRAGDEHAHPSTVASADVSPANPVPNADAAPAHPTVGLTHERLLEIYGYADGGHDAQTSEDEVATAGSSLAADTTFVDQTPAPIQRARYAIQFPDERVTLQTERALRVDDQGDRASVTLVGTGLPAIPGMRVSARTALSGFVLVGADGTRYRPSAPDELAQWFTGATPASGTTLSFRRTDNIILVTRGGLSLSILADHQGDLHPLTCRMMVALLLGGDPNATRLGCANARMPVRAVLRARGFVAMNLERVENQAIEVPRAVLAVPPPNATPDLAPPQRPSDGAFFAPSELGAMGGVFRPEYILSVNNTMGREALVFVNDLAVGWIAAGHSAQFVGLPLGPHTIRARSIDGLERSHSTEVTLPASVRLENAAVPVR